MGNEFMTVFDVASRCVALFCVVLCCVVPYCVLAYSYIDRSCIGSGSGGWRTVPSGMCSWRCVRHIASSIVGGTRIDGVEPGDRLVSLVCRSSGVLQSGRPGFEPSCFATVESASLPAQWFAEEGTGDSFQASSCLLLVTTIIYPLATGEW